MHIQLSHEVLLGWRIQYEYIELQYTATSITWKIIYMRNGKQWVMQNTLIFQNWTKVKRILR